MKQRSEESRKLRPFPKTPTMEQSKPITKVLFALSFALYGANLALMILFLPPENKLQTLLPMAILHPAVLAFVAVVASNPKLNRKYGVKIGWKGFEMKRKVYPSEPTPSYLLMCGSMAVLVSLLFMLGGWTEYSLAGFPQKLGFATNIVLAVAATVPAIHFSRKAEKEFQQEK